MNKFLYLFCLTVPLLCCLSRKNTITDYNVEEFDSISVVIKNIPKDNVGCGIFSIVLCLDAVALDSNYAISQGDSVILCISCPDWLNDLPISSKNQYKVKLRDYYRDSTSIESCRCINSRHPKFWMLSIDSLSP
ncbi:MAG: hypothetical protein H6607_09595 [Flavobacteriales bacterium]|nr:hypothetical protein [Flavobacteriales bacterium]